MKRTAYLHYSPSQSIWLDKLPSHWEQLRVKHVIDRMESGVSVNSEAAPALPGEVGVLKTSCVYSDQFVPAENKRVLDDELDRVACSVKAGRLIISRMNTPDLVGSCGYVPRDYPDLFLPDRLWQTIFNATRGCSPRFAWYYLISQPAKSAISSLAAGTSGSMQNIGQDAFMGISFPLPPLDEQQAIVGFLDEKTLQIDALVAQKRQLIEKLKEKRHALIARTVTRGLPPQAARAAGLESNPELKDSAMEWYGPIPAHWKITKLKHATSRVFDCPHDTPDYDPSGAYCVVRTADISSGVLDLSRAYRVDEPEYLRRIRRAAVLPLDVLYGREGERWGFAVVAPVEPKVCLGQRMMQFRAGDRFNPRFLMWHLNARPVYEQGALDTSGSTAPHVNVETIRNYRLVEPPLPEQEAIANFIDDQTSELDLLAEGVQKAMMRLTEYRQSLVTSAITGKIDVRESA